MTWRARLSVEEKTARRVERRGYLRVCGYVWGAALVVFVMACALGKTWP